MAEIVEMIDAQGQLVEVSTASPAPAPDPAAPPPSEGAPGDSAPPPDTPAAPASPEVEPPAAPATAPVTDSEDRDPDSREVPRGVQKRFDTLTRQREEERREKIALQQRYDRDMADLRGQLAMLTRLQRGEEPGHEPVPLHQQPEPSAEDYASQEDWFRATREWDKAQLKAELVREQYQQAAQAEEFQRQQAMQAREATVRQQHADYDEQISQLGARGMTPQVYQALLYHEMGPDLAYFLAQHPDDLQRLAPLPPMLVWRELGKLEMRLQGNGTPSTPTAPSVVTSSQPKPAPLTPVGSSGGGAPVPALDDPNLSQREWEAAAERQHPGIFRRGR